MKLEDVLDPLSCAGLVHEGYAGFTENNEFFLNLRMFYDKKHSWLEVPIHLLAMMKLLPNDFSKYCYIDREKSRLYLDEDIDVGMFMKACYDWPKNINRGINMSKAMEFLGDDAIAEWNTIKDCKLVGESLVDSIQFKTNSETDFIKDFAKNDKGQSIH